MPPAARFGTALHPNTQKNYVAIAVGSGITPIMSVLATTLQIETRSRFTLIYANRTASSTMFRQELTELESRYGAQLKVLHILSRIRLTRRHSAAGSTTRSSADGSPARSGRTRSTTGSCAGQSSS